MAIVADRYDYVIRPAATSYAVQASGLARASRGLTSVALEAVSVKLRRHAAVHRRRTLTRTREQPTRLAASQALDNRVRHPTST